MKYLKSKTLWLAVLAGATGILTVLGEIDPSIAGKIQACLAVLAFINRFITTLPLNHVSE